MKIFACGPTLLNCFDGTGTAGVYAILAFVAAWLIAQGWKTIEGLVCEQEVLKGLSFKEKIGYLFRSGGMPSGHTASFTALGVLLGCVYGFGSGIFALAAGVWTIIIYDAMHVRYAVGVQGAALNRLLKKAGERELPIVEGHTLPQVLVGAVIGVIVGLGVFLVAKGGFGFGYWF